MPPLVSIITPTYNSEKYISEMIESVIDQDYNNWELLITDDASSDNTVKRLIEYSKKDQRIKYFQLKKNSGAGIARNNSIKYAKGKYMAFLDSDDLWHFSKLRKQISFMESNSVRLSFSSYFIIDKNGKSVGKFIKALNKVNYNTMLKNNYIGCLTAIYNCQELGNIQMPNFRKRQDWGLWLKLLKKTEYAISLDEPLAFYRMGNASLSSSKFNLLKSNYSFYKTHLGFSHYKSFYMLLIFLYNHLIYKKYNTKEC